MDRVNRKWLAGRIMGQYVYIGTAVGAVFASYYLGINNFDKRKLIIGLLIIFAGIFVGARVGSNIIKEKGLEWM